MRWAAASTDIPAAAGRPAGRAWSISSRQQPTIVPSGVTCGRTPVGSRAAASSGSTTALSSSRRRIVAAMANACMFDTLPFTLAYDQACGIGRGGRFLQSCRPGMLQDLEIESSGWPHPGMADRAPGGATGRVSAALAAAPAALLIVVGGAAVVATGIAAAGRGQGGWWAFVLVLVAWVLGVAGLMLAAQSRTGDARRAGVAAVAVAVVAVIVAGHGLPSPALPLAASDRLAGRGLPAPVRYTALVLVVATLVALVIALAAVLAAQDRKR